MTDIYTSALNKVVVFDKVSCNNGNNWQYILGYQVDGETILPLFIKKPKNIFSYGESSYNKNSAYAMSLELNIPHRNVVSREDL